MNMAPKRFMSKKVLSMFCGVVLLVGCGGGGSGERIEIPFTAKFGDKDFQCGATFSNIGSTRSTIRTSDLRFFVSNPRFVRSDGREEPLFLDQDSMWQLNQSALLDFEDGTSDCVNGDTPRNTSIRGEGSIPENASFRFEIGLPLELNHVDAASAPSPLNRTALWWNWNLGFRFFVFEFVSRGLPKGFLVHLGSTGCQGNEGGGIKECESPNRPTITLPGFTAGDKVNFNLAKLVESTNVDFNQKDSAPGCMSFPGDTDCTGIFSKFGLGFGSSPAAPQDFVELVN
jgi:uncharacterized repeat protein (TIGR04052 family)